MPVKQVLTKVGNEISEIEQFQILKEHFNLLYVILSESKLIQNAVFETVGEVQRCLSGIPMHYHNAVLGCPAAHNSDNCIKDQLSYFNKAKMPFVWYLDEKSNPEFKKKLLDHDFQDGGVFRGVIGILDKPIPNPEVSNDYTLELVKD